MNIRHDTKVVYTTNKKKISEITYWKNFFDKNFSGVIGQLLDELTHRQNGTVMKFEITNKPSFH
jgi:hypothetical protein